MPDPGITADPERIYKVVLFGVTGCGMSSIVNLLADRRVANVSTDAESCTKRAQWYPVSLGDKKFRLWDTMGFNQAEAKPEDSNTLSPYEQAHALLRNLQDGVDLILLCARRDGINASLRSLYWLLDDFFFNQQAPIALVLTNFDVPNEQWWDQNKDAIVQKCNIRVESLPHACITTLRGGSSWTQSKQAMEALLLNHINITPTPTSLHLDLAASAIQDLSSKCSLSDSDAKILVEKFKLPKRIFRAVLFGETGVGKSSVINLILGQPVARISDKIAGCTLDSRRYEVQAGIHQFSIWDTVGLNSLEKPRSVYGEEIEHAARLVCELHEEGGLDLLVFCTKSGRLSATEQKSLVLFREHLCKSQVPVSIIITSLENKSRMDDWWEENVEDLLKFCKLEPSAIVGHACITSLTLENPNPQLQDKLNESRHSVLTMLEDSITHGSSFRPGKATWIMSFLKGVIVEIIRVGSSSWWGRHGCGNNDIIKDCRELTKEQVKELNRFAAQRNK